VREAIDRGVPLEEIKPGNAITAQLKKLMLPQNAAKGSAMQSPAKKFKLSWAR
jgi:pilus assembly protein CpaE